MSTNKPNGYNANYILLAIFLYFGLVFVYLQNNPKMLKTEVSFGPQRYTATGMDMNCNQDPLYLETSPEQFEPPDFLEDKRFAYAWYAASTEYLCSALTAMKLLKDLRKESPLALNDVDYVLTYVKSDLNDTKSEALVQQWEEEGGVLKEFESLRKYSKDAIYQASFQKFHTFKLTEYARVVFMDADGMPLNNLDHLFLLRFPLSVVIAAPQGYWFRNQGVAKSQKNKACPGILHTVVTSALMVFEPSEDLFNKVEKHFDPPPDEVKMLGKSPNFDMDIVNREFSCTDSVLVLPKHYGTLDSEYYERDDLHRKFYRCQDFAQVQYMHFSSKGKPWLHHKQTSDRIYRLSYGKEARAAFRRWFRTAHGVCPWLVDEMTGNSETEVQITRKIKKKKQKSIK